MGATQMKEWYHNFKDGRSSVESDGCSGRPNSRNCETVKEIWRLVSDEGLLNNNRRNCEESGNFAWLIWLSILTDNMAMTILTEAKDEMAMNTEQVNSGFRVQYLCCVL